jgi:CRISPR/Cas system-associated endonuclease Cas1
VYELNNTVYITTQNTHLRLSNENLVVEPPDQPMRHVPLHHLTAIVLLGNIQVTTPMRMNILITYDVSTVTPPTPKPQPTLQLHTPTHRTQPTSIP